MTRNKERVFKNKLDNEIILCKLRHIPFKFKLIFCLDLIRDYKDLQGILKGSKIFNFF